MYTCLSNVEHVYSCHCFLLLLLEWRKGDNGETFLSRNRLVGYFHGSFEGHIVFYPCGLQVASYEFTTLTCIPGVITYRGAKIQVISSKTACFMCVLFSGRFDLFWKSAIWYYQGETGFWSPLLFSPLNSCKFSTTTNESDFTQK